MPENLTYSEKELLTRIAGGEEKGFMRLFDRYRMGVYMHVLGIIKSPLYAEEITQDIFMTVWKKREDLIHITSFTDWLFIITRNRCFSELRKKLTSSLEIRETADDWDPLRHIELKEINNLLLKAIEQLSPRRKEIFLLSRMENKTHQQIADLLGISPGTVNVHLVQALSILRTFLNNYEKNGEKGGTNYICLLFLTSLCA